VEQRRLLIALVISLVFVVLYQELVLNRYRRTPPTTVSPAPRSMPAETTPAPREPGHLAAAPGDSVVDVDTDVFHAQITVTGGRLSSLQLKAFRQTVRADSPPLDVVQAGSVLPGTLEFEPSRSDAGIAYRADRTELVLRGDERGEIVLSGEARDGARIEKRYGFSGNSYVFDLSAAVSAPSPPQTVGLVLTPLSADSPRAHPQVAIGLANHHLVEKHLPDLTKQSTTIDGAEWAGFAAQYFLTVALPANGTAPAVLSAGDDTPIVRLDAPVQDGRAHYEIYAGPKERETLYRAGHDLDRALDFGKFFFIAVPLLQALRLLHRLTGNYGVAIIILTAMVKVATMPLTRVMFRNMREMQKIQPQMAKLRERHKDDQVALQKEMMELYRRHRVNPFSGCLPMLLQLPILYGLYSALSLAIELRHAPFILWIRDLSAPDWLQIGSISIPVLTLLMGASMLVQQWLTPQQGDPTQQRMMMFMPLVFTYMFINFPAGLVLYWLVNNVLTIGQQYVMMRSMT
jgi:YidC/Oxa1 family membrane protein insertase